MVSNDMDCYEVLGIERGATDKEVRRTYRNLITRAHPDKGGDAARFADIQRAYEVLSDDVKRKQYDATGRFEKSADEEFLDGFGGGNFRDKMREQEMRKESMAEQLAVRQEPASSSHTAGFEAWMRSRGGAEKMTYTTDNVVEDFGVVKASYDAVPLAKIAAHQVTCTQLGKPADGLEVEAKPIPPALEWGEVLVSVRAAPINPGDLTTVTFGIRGGWHDAATPPFIAGHDCVGVVAKVGPGVKGLEENDWVVPMAAGMGTWRSLAVWKEKELLKIRQDIKDIMPLEYLAMYRELCTAYRILEDFGSLKPGDSVIVNAATSTVGQVVIQLCQILKLRAVAVIRRHEQGQGAAASFNKTVNWLKSLGADQVFEDEGNLREKLNSTKFFARPKLGLDCVGGASAVRLSEALSEGGLLVIYGCMTGKPPTWPWNHWVMNELKVSGFNLRRWMKEHSKKKVISMLESLAKLAAADKLRIEYTEYELSTEFGEALEHAQEPGRATKVLLKVTDIGNTY